MRPLLVNLLISLAAIVFSLLVLEGGVRYHFSQHRNYDFEMWRYAAELKEPLAGSALPFHHKPNRAGNYYGVEIRTNSHGLRDVEQKIPKPGGVKRVLMLGDSFTLGWGVPFTETFGQQLERMLTSRSGGYEVVNMGVGNYNSAMEVELFKRKGLALEPDIVVLMYYINDVEPTPASGGIGYPLFKRLYLPAYIGARLKQLGMMNRADDWLQAYYRELYAPDASGLRNAHDAIAELIRITAEKKIKLLVVNIPDLRRLQGYPFGFASVFPQRLATENALPFLDLLPFFDKYEGKSLWVTNEDAHMNSLANRIAAQAIFATLVREKMVE